VEHGGDADAGAEVLRVCRNRQHRLRRCAKQQVVDRCLVLERDVGDLGWEREDDVEVADREQVRLALGQPGARGVSLALGAVPVATAVVGDPQMSAVLTGLHVAAQRGGAALLDRRHHLELGKAQMPSMGGPVPWTRGAEDVGDLDRGAHRLSRARSLPP
jgi:hypothetical protein